MDYEVDKKRCRITVRGSSEEVKKFLITLESVITGGNQTDLSEALENTSEIGEFEQYNFDRFQRVYFNRKSAIYLMNANSSSSINRRIFTIFEDNFEQTLKRLGYEFQ